MNKYYEISNYLNDIQDALTQLLSSGFNASHEYTSEIIKNLAEEGKVLGLAYAEEKLNLLYKALESKRHVLKFEFDKFIEEYCRLNEYCIICRKQLDLLKAEELLATNE